GSPRSAAEPQAIAAAMRRIATADARARRAAVEATRRKATAARKAAAARATRSAEGQASRSTAARARRAAASPPRSTVQTIAPGTVAASQDEAARADSRRIPEETAAITAPPTARFIGTRRARKARAPAIGSTYRQAGSSVKPEVTGSIPCAT